MAAPPPNLSNGLIAMICSGEADPKPLLQVLDLRPVNTASNANERYRTLLSDGLHLQAAMLATQMNLVIKSGRLQKGSNVQLTDFICNLIQNRKIINVINLEIVVKKSEPIGEPKPYVDTGTVTGQSLSMNQPGVGATTHQPYGGRNASGVVASYVKVENGSMPSGLGGCNNVAATPRPSSNSYGRPAQSVILQSTEQLEQRSHSQKRSFRKVGSYCCSESISRPMDSQGSSYS